MHVRGSTVAAIKLIIYVAKRGGDLVSLEQAADEVGQTRSNVTKLAFRLKRGGFLEAFRGPRGGVKLARDARDILVGDIVHFLEGYEGKGPKYLRAGRPAEGDVDRVISDWIESIVAVLNQHSIADFLAEARTSRDRPGKTLKVQRRMKAH